MSRESDFKVKELEDSDMLYNCLIIDEIGESFLFCVKIGSRCV